MQELNNLVDSLEKNIMSSVNKIKRLEEINVDLREELSLYKDKYLEQINIIEVCEETCKSLKIANTILGSNNNTKDTKLEINSLIREIDYCISQLTEQN
jgi:hypothetical protein